MQSDNEGFRRRQQEDNASAHLKHTWWLLSKSLVPSHGPATESQSQSLFWIPYWYVNATTGSMHKARCLANSSLGCIRPSQSSPNSFAEATNSSAGELVRGIRGRQTKSYHTPERDRINCQRLAIHGRPIKQQWDRLQSMVGLSGRHSVCLTFHSSASSQLNSEGDEQATARGHAVTAPHSESGQVDRVQLALIGTEDLPRLQALVPR